MACSRANYIFFTESQTDGPTDVISTQDALNYSLKVAQ
jgi:hypothetical protein